MVIQILTMYEYKVTISCNSIVMYYIMKLLGLLTALVVAVARCEAQAEEGKQLVMLEIERLSYPGEDKVVKRQAQVQYGGAPGQYVVQTSDQQQVYHDLYTIPEYYSHLLYIIILLN